MRFAIDENVPLMVATALTGLGHDCFVVAKEAHRSLDEDIMARSRREQRVLVTFDADFSRMIFHELRPPPLGIVYMRGRPEEARLVSERFVTMFASNQIDLHHRFIVIEPNGDVRSLPLDPTNHA